MSWSDREVGALLLEVDVEAAVEADGCERNVKSDWGAGG